MRERNGERGLCSVTVDQRGGRAQEPGEGNIGKRIRRLLQAREPVRSARVGVAMGNRRPGAESQALAVPAYRVPEPAIAATYDEALAR